MKLGEFKRAGTINPEQGDSKGQSEDHRSFVRFRWRVLIWTAILILALLATAPDPRAFYLIPLYPNGFDRAIGNSGANGGGAAGYLVHASLLVAMLATRRRSFFLIVTLILIVVCALTTKGCHEILNGLSIDG